MTTKTVKGTESTTAMTKKPTWVATASVATALTVTKSALAMMVSLLIITIDYAASWSFVL
jgi:hypothetical protein